jgi:hypothetical protein
VSRELAGELAESWQPRSILPVSELPRWWLFMLIAILVCVIASGIITVVKL